MEKDLDHEVTREYLITILATDKGEPPLSNTAVLAINVTDVNDNPPKFSQSGYTVYVQEDVKTSTEIFKVSVMFCSFVKLCNRVMQFQKCISIFFNESFVK